MAAEFHAKAGGSARELSLFGQDAVPSARRLAQMNLLSEGRRIRQQILCDHQRNVTTAEFHHSVAKNTLILMRSL